MNPDLRPTIRRAGLRVLAACVSLSVCAGTAARAADNDWSGTYSFQVENDRIAQTDRHYTNGLRLSWISDKKTDGSEWVRDALQFLYPLADLRAGRIGAALGQNIYTPEDTDAVSLVRDDRPYAGWLYGSASIHAETTRNFWAMVTRFTGLGGTQPGHCRAAGQCGGCPEQLARPDRRLAIKRLEQSAEE
ncbi:MAG: DUF2219 family protein [Rhodospirillaceae bacterium]|nr:DUF2219 family protein [Rhodospirillaceae bacterium]